MKAAGKRKERAEKTVVKGLSGKEMEVVSYLEFEGRRFFRRGDIRDFFTSDNEMNVYIHRLKEKGRIIKLNKDKYYLVPIKAYKGKWSEHPFVIVDEMFNGEDYCVGGKAAAHYWGLIEQIPTRIDAFSKTRQGEREIFGFVVKVRRVRNLPEYVKEEINDHSFLVATEEESKRWI